MVNSVLYSFMKTKVMKPMGRRINYIALFIYLFDIKYLDFEKESDKSVGKLHNYELYNLYSSTDFIRVVKRSLIPLGRKLYVNEV